MARPLLALCGPYEFLADDPWRYGPYADAQSHDAAPPAPEARTALAAYTLLRVDAGWLSAKAAQWLKKGAGSVPRGFSEIGTAPRTRTVDTAIGTIGIVFFPEGPVPGKAPDPAQEQAVLEAGRSLKERCALVLGISPWGYVGERDFLPKAEGVFNVILGGGEGVGFGHSLSNKGPGVLWLRPDSQGRAVNILEIHTLPSRGVPYVWREEQTFSARLEWLDEKYRSDPAMEKIVGAPER